jgi:hypothetical protein
MMVAAASAIDVKVKGQWWFAYDYHSNTSLASKDDTGYNTDRLRFRQRIRTQVQFIADENLSAMLNFETNLVWGSAAAGNQGRLNADENYFVIKHAYLDWTIPNTKVKTRMGMQGIALPSVTFGNNVFQADVAGVSVSTQFTPEIGLTAFWARPFDSSFDDGQTGGKNSFDDVDMFGFMVPIRTNAVRFTPWAAIALIGKDSDLWGGPRGQGLYGSPLLTAAGKGLAQAAIQADGDSTSMAWWVGTTFELPIVDPFFVKIDAMMGGVDTGASLAGTDLDTFGYFLAADIGYKFNFGALSLFGWYSSGNKDEDDMGYMPVVGTDAGYNGTFYAVNNVYDRHYTSLLSPYGLGMWGIGLKLADVSFVDKLKHTAMFAYMGGTNQGDSIDRRAVAGTIDQFGGSYLMTSDRAYEISIRNQYKVTDNLELSADFAYVWLDLGDHWSDKEDTTGSFAAMLGVQYMF